MLELSLFSAFLVGLLGGGHCVGMCGGIVGAVSLALPGQRPPLALHFAYNAGRIASVCLGAETRALRNNVPMTAFTLQACLRVLRGRWSPDAPQPAQTAPGADWNTDPEDTSIRRGLSDAAISSTVDASWRSIERDCASVAPLSSTAEPAARTPVVVTLTVGSTGRVRSASARAAGNRELELCIESSVRSWPFPQAIGSTLISIPLTFDAHR